MKLEEYRATKPTCLHADWLYKNRLTRHTRPLFFHSASLLFLLFFAAVLSVRADRGVKFKAKTYEPRKTFKGKTYEAKPYSPNVGTVRSETYTPAHTGSWKTQDERRTAPARPFDGGAGKAPAQTFTPRDTPSVKTFKTDPADVQERKPFVKNAPDLEHKSFTPPEKKDEYNPMLTPRQGIKEEHLNGK